MVKKRKYRGTGTKKISCHVNMLLVLLLCLYCLTVHSFSFPASFAVVEGLVLGSTKNVIGFIFTSDKWVSTAALTFYSRRTHLNYKPYFRKIIGLVSHLLNAYCFLQFFDGLVVSFSTKCLLPKACPISQMQNFCPSRSYLTEQECTIVKRFVCWHPRVCAQASSWARANRRYQL